MEIRGRALFEATTPQQTTLTLQVEIPGMDESMEQPMRAAIEGSVRNMKELIETDV